ncbi:MFS transporter [Anaerostipes sp.]|uniref:MFS transporter n=1 Tax=Anaerostipes sp. TaxID=1872530 RepID=UPI0025BD41B9|nr:glycoside-pentoside-hexuronide (GPH):cation symporter [Anaerostipes sp.]MBS7008761.1 glycoside-pentoside-hexuronide (GPH):cation symporter [Anaerostipes sp.]
MSQTLSNTIQQQDSGEVRLSWRNRLAYGCGDTACNIVMAGMVNSLLTLFYTDYAGVPIATVGLVMLISRFFDGSSDVIMGIIVEKTKSKWGKARPWILWMSIPYVICSIALFTIPQTSATLQFWYIFITYNLLATVCYTAINVPYGTLSAMMTRSSHERDMLSIVRMSLAPVGRLIAVTLSLPIVKLFGDDKAAWVKAMILWSALAFILLLICFINCKEHVQITTKTETPKVSIGKSLRALLSNRYFWATLILWTVTVVQQTLAGTLTPYYCKYIFGNDTWYSILYMGENITLIAGALLCPVLLKKFSKRNLCLAGCVIAAGSQAALLLNQHSFHWMLAITIIRAVGQAPITAVIFGMMGDVIEYGQWKSHIRQESLIFGGGSLGFKIGSGVSAAIVTSLLGMSGFISSATGGAIQPESAKQMIVNLYQYGILFIWAAAIIVLIFYRLDKIYPQIMQDLAERENRGEL